MELISAISTAAGTGGVAIIRVSGDHALSLAKKMFSGKGEFEPNKLYPGVIDGGEIRDRGMCVYFRAPHSFTGEDTVEFHCHGGREIAGMILKRTFSLGARQAERGEFTRRAFLNGKLSLSAVEGLGEMISAQSLSEARAGYSLYEEKLTKKVQSLQEILKSCLAEADADVDYPEEDLSLNLLNSLGERATCLEKEIEALLSGFSAGKKVRFGVKVALCGRPNSGKSSLLNALLGYERAIVSDTEGTTRDLIEESLEINGVRFLLIDTAGLRSSSDAIEREGVRRAGNAIKGADLVLYLKEKDDEIDLPEDVPKIVIGAKCDLKMQDGCEIYVSSLTGKGIKELKDLIFERGYGRQNEDVLLIEERHKEALEEALEAISRLRKSAERGAPTELVAEELKSAYFALGKITGESANEEILKEIFSKFCVGK